MWSRLPTAEKNRTISPILQKKDYAFSGSLGFELGIVALSKNYLKGIQKLGLKVPWEKKGVQKGSFHV